MSGIRVIVQDLATGEELERHDLIDDFIVLAEGDHVIDNVVKYPTTGTQVVTVKRRRPSTLEEDHDHDRDPA